MEPLTIQVEQDLLAFSARDGGYGAAIRLSKIFSETGMVVTEMKPLHKHIHNASVADYHGKFLYFTGGQHY